MYEEYEYNLYFMNERERRAFKQFMKNIDENTDEYIKLSNEEWDMLEKYNYNDIGGYYNDYE